MRLFTASLATETNMFSPIPTSVRNFEEAYAWRPGEHPDAPRHCTAPLYVGRKRARQDGFTLIEGSCFWAEPSGTCAKASYEAMRDEILEQLRAAMPVDGILFGLHGAFVADGYDDCEGDLLERARAIAGAACVIGVELDLHCHLTRKRVELADIIILYKEYPHIDFVERADELLTLVLKTIRGEVKPKASLYDCRTIGFYPTTIEPVRGFVDHLSALEREDGVLSVSFGHGFPHADVPEMGARILVYTDASKGKGDAVATRLGAEVIAMRGRSSPPLMSFDEALDVALAMDTSRGPVVIAEPADNAGGGSASDNTLSLRALIDRGVTNAALGPLWDPQAVAFAHIAGVGARLRMRLGGKTSELSGLPVDADVEVIGLAKDSWQSFGAARVGLGDIAALRVEGRIDVVAIAHRTQALGRELFTHAGIDPTRKSIVVVKSAQHFHAAFGPIATKVLYTETQGPSTHNYAVHPYEKLQRPIHPLDSAGTEGRLVL